METTQLRNQAQAYVEQLSTEKLKVALDFLAYLIYREEEEADEATRELLAIPDFERDLAAAEKRANAGELIDWRDIRKDI